MPTATDGLGHTLELKRPARRVVSLVPSLTEAVAVFGKPEALVGCTKFCEEPPNVVSGLRKLGGTKDPNIEAIVALEPDLVLANKEENRQEDVEALIAAGLNVYVGDAPSVGGAIDELEQVMTLLSAVPFKALREMRAELDRQTQLSADRPRVRVFCPIWRNPYLAVGGNTYAGDVLRLVGAENVFEAHPSGSRYPQVSLANIEAAAPDVILLPSEPFHFRERHRDEFLALRSLPASQNDAVSLFDGRALTWYGPRITESLETIEALVDQGRPDWEAPAREPKAEARDKKPSSGSRRNPSSGYAPGRRAKPRSSPRPRRNPSPNASGELPPSLRLDLSQQDVVDEDST